MKHTSPISGIAVHADRYVATAGYDNRVILWDQTNGEPIARSWHDHLANHCAFSPDGTHLVSSSSDYTARVWSVPDMALVAVLNDHGDDVEMSVFHPDGDLIATASRDHVVRVYDLAGTLVHEFEGHTADVISVEWAGGGDDLITSSDDGTVKRWSRSRGALVEDIDLGGAETDTVVSSPDGVVYAGNDDGEIVVIAASGTHRVDAHAAGIKRLVLAPERGLLVSLSYDRTMRLWDVSAPEPALVTETEFPTDVWPRSCAFGHGPRLLFGTFGVTYRTFDYERRVWLDEAVAPTPGVNAVIAHEGALLTVGDAGIVRRDGEVVAETGSLCNFLVAVGGRVLTGGQTGAIFDAETGAVVHTHHSPLNCAAVIEREGVEHVVVGAYTGEGVVLRVGPEGPVHLGDATLHDGAIKGIAADGGQVFSVCADQSVAWHHADTLDELHRVQTAHDRIVNACVALDAGGFASVGRDLALRLWDDRYDSRARPAPLRHSLKCLAASADRRLVATGTYDGHVAVFDRALDAWSTPVRASAAGISAITWDDAQGAFVASSYDGELHTVVLR
jgi:toxoflavin biosynthesis protein ToxC